MTSLEIRQARRARREWIQFTIHMSILIAFGILILGNLAGITVAQEDTLNQVMELRIDTTSTEEPESPLADTTEATSRMLTPDEFDLVCRVVAAEARGEDLQGQMAVANVILDRAVLWDMSVTEVLTAPGQFAGPYSGKIDDETRLAVANVFEGGLRAFEEPVTHFHEESVNPYWTSGKVDRGRIGNHRFYY